METIILKNEVIELHVLTLGATIQRFIYKGNDIVLGYDNIEDYLKYDGCLGATVGRVANRIAKGEFTLNGKTYHLAINNGPNAIHGGIKGFSYQDFTIVKHDETMAVLRYISADKEEGYPGTLTLDVVYTLDDHTVRMEYKAAADKDTLINITNHSYFNLSGKAIPITTHELQVEASEVCCVDKDGLTLPEHFMVDNTPFDYRTMRPIAYGNHEQIEIAIGFDHHYIFDTPIVHLYYPDNHTMMTLETSLPGAQIYTANYLTKRTGKYNQTYEPRTALCIEPQMMPDSIHLEQEPMVILRKGDTYDHFISYTLSDE